MEISYLFVYGTLRSECSNAMRDYLSANAVLIGRGVVKGRLYLIDYYPGVIDGDGMVVGDVYRLFNPHETYKVLDDYEECGDKHPTPHEYIRKPIEVSIDGWQLTADIYLYNRDVNGLKEITSGNFMDIFGKKNGCFNRVFKETVTVKDGFGEDGRMRFKEIPFPMSTDCKYDKRLNDLGCAGCKHVGQVGQAEKVLAVEPCTERPSWLERCDRCSFSPQCPFRTEDCDDFIGVAK